MSEPHRIRLRGPWEVEALESFAADRKLPAAARMSIPCTWGDGGWADFRGRARHRRAFGKPREFDPSERTWLVVEGVTGSAEIRLNGQELGAMKGPGGFERDVTEILQPRNQLEIDVTCDQVSGGLIGEVRLEIRAPGDAG